MTEDRIGQWSTGQGRLRRRRARHRRRTSTRRRWPRSTAATAWCSSRPWTSRRSRTPSSRCRRSTSSQDPRERIALVATGRSPRADLRESDISRTLDMPIIGGDPGRQERSAPPSTAACPSRVGIRARPPQRSCRELAELLLPQVGAADAKGGRATASRRRSACQQPSAGRHSLFNAGVSKFSKSKDKKAA